MGWQNMWQLAKSDYLKLLPIMLLAFYMAFIPHLNYLYPVHVDEWVHLAFSKAMIGAHDATFMDPFLGQLTMSLSSNLEVGFHVLWGVFYQISGIPWLTIFRYFPSIVFVITVLSVYVLARREGFGWEAALVTCLIPTSVGILGPAFLVPVTIGLLFIPLSLFTAFNFRSGWSYLVLFIFVCFLLSIHAPSAICLVIILIPHILLNVKANFMHSLGVTLALVIPFLAPFPWIFDMLLPAAKALFSPVLPSPHVVLPPVIQAYGYLPVALCLLGTFILCIRDGKKNYSLVLGLLTVLLMLVVFFTFHYGLEIMYQRGLMFAMLMMGIVAGAGLRGVKELRLPERISSRLKAPLITQGIGTVLCLVLIGLTLATGIPARQDTFYYHMIDEQDCDAFRWIGDNLSADYDKAILDPWKATAFTAITEKHVYTRIHAFPTHSDRKAYEFLRGGCTDTAFLRERGISIVYNRGSCSNPDLVEVRENIYLLKEAGTE